MIAHGIVSARLDYCNSLLSGTSGGNSDRLQVVQNALARTRKISIIEYKFIYSTDITKMHSQNNSTLMKIVVVAANRPFRL